MDARFLLSSPFRRADTISQKPRNKPSSAAEETRPVPSPRHSPIKESKDLAERGVWLEIPLRISWGLWCVGEDDPPMSDWRSRSCTDGRDEPRDFARSIAFETRPYSSNRRQLVRFRCSHSVPALWLRWREPSFAAVDWQSLTCGSLLHGLISNCMFLAMTGLANYGRVSCRFCLCRLVTERVS
jgi:hypothetical protein